MASRNRDESKNEEDEDDTRFPTGQMVTLAICKFSEPIAFNSVIAYTYVMVQWLHNGDERNASFYAGLLVSVYAFGEVLTTVLWGYISDRIGRKPVVLFGLCGVGISSLMFGLAQRYWVALLARLIGGMLNGNVAVMQTMLAEMVKRPEHEPTAYAIHPFVWSAGGILGSAMGGYLSQPAQFYPGTFSPDGLFGRYPYLLPNLVCVVAIAIAVIQGAIFLKETNPMMIEKDRAKERAKALATSEAVDERTPLRIADRKVSDSELTQSTDESGSLLNKKPSLLVEEQGLPSATDPHFDLRRSSFGTMHSIKVSPPQLEPSADKLKKPDLRTTFNFTVVMLITSFVLCSYHGMGYSNLLPIYLLDKPHSTKPGLDLQGGLGYDVHDVGSFMAVNGFIAILIQALVFPIFVRKVGVWKSYISMTLLYPISYTLVPFLTALPAGSARSAGIYAIMVFQNYLNIIIPPCMLILIKNATPSPLVLGTVNGACMALICAARTAAPPVEGLIYGAGGSAAAWFSMTGVAVIAVVQLFWVPREHVHVEKVDVEAPGFKRKSGDVRNSSVRRSVDEHAVED